MAGFAAQRASEGCGATHSADLAILTLHWMSEHQARWLELHPEDRWFLDGSVTGMSEQPDGIEVHVSQRVVSSVPGRVGNWSYSTIMRLPVVPQPGNWLICPLPDGFEEEGDHDEVVKDVFIGPGRVHVELRPIVTDSGDTLDEIAGRGWEQHAGPWANQGSSV